MDNGITLTTENLKKACEVFDLDYDSIIKGESSNPFLIEKDKDELEKAEIKSGEEVLEKEGNADLLFKALGVEPDTLKVAIQVLPKVVQMGELVKSLEDTLNNINNSLKLENEKESFVNKVSTLIKGYDDLTGINGILKDDLKKAQDSIVSLNDRIEKIIKVPLRDKKSITSDTIQKSFTGEPNNLEGKTVYSISTQKNTINSLLGDRMQEEIQKGIADGPFSQAAMTFEASGRLSRQVLEALNKDDIVLVQ